MIKYLLNTKRNLEDLSAQRALHLLVEVDANPVPNPLTGTGIPRHPATQTYTSKRLKPKKTGEFSASNEPPSEWGSA
jgi:hypothetical protein